LPDGWKGGVTGAGAARWSVERDATAPSPPNVLKQSGRGAFPWCVNDAAIADGFVEVKMKPVSGREDQAGGVVWRWKDGDNYYVARANALENNVSLYYTARGVRKTLKIRRCAGRAGPVAHAARRFRRHPDRRLARRQALYRLRRRPHHRLGVGRRLDQGGQRHRVRRVRPRRDPMTDRPKGSR
jgi:hypothetical protein